MNVVTNEERGKGGEMIKVEIVGQTIHRVEFFSTREDAFKLACAHANRIRGEYDPGVHLFEQVMERKVVRVIPATFREVVDLAKSWVFNGEDGNYKLRKELIVSICGGDPAEIDQAFDAWCQYSKYCSNPLKGFSDEACLIAPGGESFPSFARRLLIFSVTKDGKDGETWSSDSWTSPAIDKMAAILEAKIEAKLKK